MEGNVSEMQLEHVLSPILNILNTSMNVSVELLERLYQGQQVNELLKDLNDAVNVVFQTQKSVNSFFSRASVSEMIDNLKDTLQMIEDCILQHDLEQASYLAEFQILPFFRLLKEAFYFWGYIYLDEKRMKEYYDVEFAAHYSNPYISDEGEYDYKVSIVVPAYNHLDTTKQCISNLLKYTDFEKINAELILIDHGSSDGTFDYFKSIDGAKVIRFKHNVRMYMFALMSMVCRGKYMVLVSNDILVTQNWAQNLLACMESDDKIAMAVPMTPNICNLQMLRVPTNDPTQFVLWANQFNCSQPNLWSDRARLMPPVCMYRTSVVSELGLADPYLYSMEFWDDDFSLRVRRAGYRQILCEDTACYHFGSVTSKEAQKKENTLQYGRELFEKKTGVDAWGTGFCYDYTAIQIFQQISAQNDNLDILGLDCGFGDTLLQMRNELRHLNKSCKLYNLTIEPKYEPDLKPLSDEFELYHTSMSNALFKAFAHKQFDVIYLSKDIIEYSDYEDVLRAARQRLKPNGILLLWNKNPWYVLTLNQILQFNLSEKVTFLNPHSLQTFIESEFPNVQIIPIKQEIAGVESFIKQHYAVPKHMKEKIKESLLILSHYYICGGRS
nr:glycosyltransferase [uncultured Butyricicoccus sp.]